jgi:hypothetical protein
VSYVAVLDDAGGKGNERVEESCTPEYDGGFFDRRLIHYERFLKARYIFEDGK